MLETRISESGLKQLEILNKPPGDVERNALMFLSICGKEGQVVETAFPITRWECCLYQGAS